MARLLDALADLPYGVARELDPADISTRAITIVGDDPRVDVLTVAWSVTFAQAWPRRMVRRIAGVRVPYLGRNDLIASKRTGRASDLADIERLAPPVRRVRSKARSGASQTFTLMPDCTAEVLADIALGEGEGALVDHVVTRMTEGAMADPTPGVAHRYGPQVFA